MDALTLVFSRTKHGAEKLMKGLVADGFNAASIHGNKSQGQRDRAIKAFRAGEDQRVWSPPMSLHAGSTFRAWPM